MPSSACKKTRFFEKPDCASTSIWTVCAFRTFFYNTGATSEICSLSPHGPSPVYHGKPSGEPPRVGVLLNRPLNVVAEGERAPRRDDAGLSHRTAERLLVT